jgi:carboxymethylenebutenolidase
MVRTEQIDAGRVNGHIAHAERPRGGIVLLPTITGVDRFAQQRAQLLAAAGFTTLIWNPYPGQTPPADLRAAMACATALNDGLVDAMGACVDYLLEKLRLDAVAVLGFCLGGRYALLLAAQHRAVAACVVYYPSIRVPAKPNEAQDAIARAADIACPVHLIHAGNDEVFIQPVFLKLRNVLEQRNAATMVQIHPGAVHSFMRPDLQSDPANAAAVRLSWPPVVGFLQTCMRPAV